MKHKEEGKILGAAKVGEKGQIVIPKDIRDLFNIKPGDSLLLFADIDRGIAIVPQADYMNFIQKVFDTVDNKDGD
ncbi:MAG: AbrB/MazE/SpoVT family DNA-binding domain-containing protein [Acholeplasmataceae bacterium]|nr:AbrB/MazE/SpoVT family DNA-binding domain-containing protein [Acholeplasmataceae bacterium]